MELTIEQVLQKGVSAHKEGNLEEAERFYRTILKSHPAHPDANHNLGLVAVSVNRVSEALPLFKAALEANSNEEQFWLSYIDALINDKQLDLAKKILDKGKQGKLSRVTAHFIDAEINYNMGRFDEAEAKYTKVILLKSDHVQAHNKLGNTLKEMGRLEEAEASYRQVIAMRTGFVEAHRNLASILRKMGKIEQAIESDRCTKFLNSLNVEENEAKKLSRNLPFRQPSPVEYPMLYRTRMGTENVGGFLRAMAQMLRPKNILEIGAGYTTPFLLEAIVNNERVFDDGNLQESYFENYTYNSKLVIVDNMSLGKLIEKPGMKDIIESKYTEFIEGNFEGKASLLKKKFGNFDFVWFDCGGPTEYKNFINEYWDICSDYIFFHFTYSNGNPNNLHDIILKNIKGNPLTFDIVEPHKSRQGSITMVQKNKFI